MPEWIKIAKIISWTRWSFLLLAAAIVGCPIGWWYARQPAVVLYDVHELDGAAAAGGHLDLIATKKEVANCVVDVVRWLFRPDPLDGSRTEWRELRDAPHSPPVLDGRTYRLVIRLPTDIEPGQWTYQAQAINHCASPLDAGPRTSTPFAVLIAPGEPAMMVPEDLLTPKPEEMQP